MPGLISLAPEQSGPIDDELPEPALLDELLALALDFRNEEH